MARFIEALHTLRVARFTIARADALGAIQEYGKEDWMPAACTICAHVDRAKIDEALLGGQSWRSLAKAFGGSKDAIGRHARAHLAVRESGPAKQAKDAARKRTARRQKAVVLEPVDLSDPAAIMGQYASLYSESRLLLEEAKAGSDLVRIERAIASCADVLDRFAKQLGLFADGGPVFNVDARTIKIDAGAQHHEFMRAFVEAVRSGQPVPELPAGLIVEGVAS